MAQDKDKDKEKVASKNYPLGATSKRFDTLGIHPQLAKICRNDLGPGQYDPKPHVCAYKADEGKWAKKLATEEFSKFLGYRNHDVLEYREYRKTCLGPGWTEVPDNTLDRGTTFSREKRFRPQFKNDNPPPGSHTLRKQRTKFSTLPSFEWDGLQSRLKDTAPSYLQPPNKYDPVIKRITDKAVSKRGPYDTFTGPRDGTTIKNHFAPPNFSPPDKYYDTPGDLDHMLTHKSKQGYGVFPKCVRFPPRNRVLVIRNFVSFLKETDYPAPDKYDIHPELPYPWEWVDNKYPFNNSNIYARPPFRHTIHPGPERYRAKLPKCKTKKKPSWMFMSKTDRSFYKIEEYTAF